MYQQITLVGNLGSDPEMRYTPSGVPVASFSLAVNKTWTGQDGQKQDKTTWFRVTTWRKTAEIVSQYLNKGSKVLVIGELEDARTWTDRDGNHRASLEVTAQTVRFLSGRGDNMAAAAESAAPGSQSTHHAESPELRDEDIPF